MADQSAQQLFQQAVAAARQRQLPQARQLIQASIRKDPQNPMAWLVLASIAENKREKLLTLKKTLELDPGNTQAQKMIREMGLDPSAVMGAAATPGDAPQKAPAESEPDSAPEPEAPPAAAPANLFSFQRDDEPDADAADDLVGYTEAVVTPPEASTPPKLRTDSMKIVSEYDDLPPPEPAIDPTEPPKPEPRPESFEERLKLYTEEGDTVAQEYLQRGQTPPGIEWVKKEKNRAGENEILLVRAALATGVFTFVVLPLTIIGVVLYNTPFIQTLLDPDETFISSIRTLTPTPTPPTTPTNTPGFTPTPSFTPTASPENQPTSSPTPTIVLQPGVSDINFVEPTNVVIPGGVGNRAVSEGLVLIEAGRAEEAIPTLASQREEDPQAFGAEQALIYYTEAVALAYAGEIDAAFDLLDEADALREEFTRDDETTVQAAIAAGYAEVYLQDGLQNPGIANQQFSRAQQNAENAINLDASWAAPRLVLVQSHKLRNNYTAALNAIEDARAVNELQEDARFLVEGADIYFRQEDYDQASYEIFLALYVDPISALAHDLRTRIALAQEDESLASLYAQTYLYYHPLVVEGWLMLGQARELEGNTNLAVEAYTQAIVVGENTEQPLALDAYLFRADVYEQRGQYAQALADVTKAAEITNDPDLLARQLNLTFEAGDLDAALSLANDLRENEEVDVPRGAIDFVEARVVMAGETLLEGDFNRAIELIAGNFGTIPTELQPLANTLRAEAYAGLGNADSALSFAEQALNTGGETARVRMVLGAAYEARGEFAQALAEYERALTLAEITVVPASIPDAAQESIRRATNSLAQQEADATATANAR